jgi:hypothetical protein
MKTHFKNPYRPPVSADQLRSAGVDPSDLYWSGTFRCWCFAGPLVVEHPYSTTGALLQLLQLTPHPEA